jgi:hypothetical protein
VKADEDIIGKFMSAMTPIDHGSLSDMKNITDKFSCLVEEAFVKCLPADGTCDLFSETKDHSGYQLTRYIIRSDSLHYNYIVDVYPTLDVKLVLSPVKRFILRNIPRKWSSINFSDIVPDISLNVRIWNTPVSCYVINCKTLTLKDVEYTYKIEQLRNTVGLPQSCDPKERNVYERSDYYVRRAIFGEVSDTVAPRHGISHQ